MQDILVGGIIATAGEVKGRVKLQKLVYLLQHMGFDLGFRDFALRDFGPFSAALAATVDWLRSADMVDEGEETQPPSCLPCYTYTPKDGRWHDVFDVVLRARFGEQKAESFKTLVRKLNGISRPVLEVAATALFIRDEMGVTEERAVWEEVERRKPHLTDHFDRARRLIGELEAEGVPRVPVSAAR